MPNTPWWRRWFNFFIRLFPQHSTPRSRSIRDVLPSIANSALRLTILAENQFMKFNRPTSARGMAMTPPGMRRFCICQSFSFVLIREESFTEGETRISVGGTLSTAASRCLATSNCAEQLYLKWRKFQGYHSPSWMKRSEVYWDGLIPSVFRNMRLK